MALFGNDRSVLPSFRTAPELDSNARSPYDDLNRIERAPERNAERNPDRNADRNPDRNADRNVERNLERNGRHLEREACDERSMRDDRRERDERPVERDERKADRNPERDETAADLQPVIANRTAQARTRETAPHPLIAGLFDKLPEPEGEWPLQARLKWLQTAANIFDLMYTAKDADGELAIRLEKNAAR